MKDRNKIIEDIVKNILEIIPKNNDELNIAIEDFDTGEILDVNIKLSVRSFKNGK